MGPYYLVHFEGTLDENDKLQEKLLRIVPVGMVHPRNPNTNWSKTGLTVCLPQALVLKYLSDMVKYLGAKTVSAVSGTGVRNNDSWSIDKHTVKSVIEKISMHRQVLGQNVQFQLVDGCTFRPRLVYDGSFDHILVYGSEPATNDSMVTTKMGRDIKTEEIFLSVSLVSSRFDRGDVRTLVFDPAVLRNCLTKCGVYDYTFTVMALQRGKAERVKAEVARMVVEDQSVLIWFPGRRKPRVVALSVEELLSGLDILELKTPKVERTARKMTIFWHRTGWVVRRQSGIALPAWAGGWVEQVYTKNGWDIIGSVDMPDAKRFNNIAVLLETIQAHPPRKFDVEIHGPRHLLVDYLPFLCVEKTVKMEDYVAVEALLLMGF